MEQSISKIRELVFKKYNSNVLILNWDVSIPGERTYRYDLITDTGLVGKSPDMFHYKEEIPYCLQSFNATPLKLLPKYINNALKIIQNKYNISTKDISELQNRINKILNLVKNSYSPQPWEHTRNLLINFYSFFDHEYLSKFIEQQYSHYWLSPIMEELGSATILWSSYPF